ncbi:MAG: DNA repair protein RadC [Anaeroplasma sp.]|uniref:JAB domain-containing protein n=1 Tax=Anaeroplasma sp. TaxID=1872523 RepID=UPI002A9100C2|nr:DNA repair protein RadC [Anaeroplasma sp.]MDY5982515.1 DNA repair protein RadC [Anaeroplasma sp.]
MLPREKIIKDGPSELSDDELLAIMLSSGTKNEDVFSMSKRLIQDYGFASLMRLDYNELSKIPGIKMAKGAKLLAIFEIARRVISEENNKKCLNDAKGLFEYVYPSYYGIKKEVLMIIGVNSRLKVLNLKKYTSDSYNEINIPIKEIIKDILQMDPYGVFIIHNHPGGNINPSTADIKYTIELGKTLDTLNILLLDHLIISNDTYYSFNENHTLKSF